MLDFLQSGGPMMWVIFGTSIIAMIIFLERLLNLHRIQINPDDFLKGIYNVLRRRNIVEAVSICEETSGPVAQIVRAAVLHHDEGPAAIQRAVEETGRGEIPRLERNLPLLATLAQITPLMGLLGTVLGMIEALMVIQSKSPLVQSGDLSGPMWQALSTTAAGLAVAIPAYVGYNFLVGRVESIVLDMERTASEIISFLNTNMESVEPPVINEPEQATSV